MTDEWMRTLQRLLTKQENMERFMLNDLARAKQELATVQAKVNKVEERIQKRRKARGKEMQDLLLMRDDPIVLVRNYGGNRSVYHSAERPCGWVGDRTGYDRVLWGQAQGEGKRPCTSCGWLADQKAHEVRPPEARDAG